MWISSLWAQAEKMTADVTWQGSSRDSDYIILFSQDEHCTLRLELSCSSQERWCNKKCKATTPILSLRSTNTPDILPASTSPPEVALGILASCSRLEAISGWHLIRMSDWWWWFRVVKLTRAHLTIHFPLQSQCCTLKLRLYLHVRGCFPLQGNLNP